MSESSYSNDTAGTSILTGTFLAWLVVGIVALIVSILTMKVVFGRVMAVELLSGYGLVLVNAVVGFIVNAIAISKAGGGFVTLGIAGTVLRIIATLIIILFIRLSKVVEFAPFVAVFLAGYFVFLLGEIVWLNRLSMRKKFLA